MLANLTDFPRLMHVLQEDASPYTAGQLASQPFSHPASPSRRVAPGVPSGSGAHAWHFVRAAGGCRAPRIELVGVRCRPARLRGRAASARA